MLDIALGIIHSYSTETTVEGSGNILPTLPQRSLIGSAAYTCIYKQRAATVRETQKGQTQKMKAKKHVSDNHFLE